MTTFKINPLTRKIVFILLLLLIFLAAPLLKTSVAAAEDSSRTKIVMLIGSEGFIAPLSEAYGKLGHYPIDLVLVNSNDLKNEAKVQKLRDSVQDADIFLLEMIGATSILAVESVLKELADSGWPGKAISTRSSPFPESLKVLDDPGESLARYFTSGGVENMRRLVLHLADNYGQVETDEPPEPVTMPGRFIYHPDAEDLTLHTQQQGVEQVTVEQPLTDDQQLKPDTAENMPNEGENQSLRDVTELDGLDANIDPDTNQQEISDQPQVDPQKSNDNDLPVKQLDNQLQVSGFKKIPVLAADQNAGLNTVLQQVETVVQSLAKQDHDTATLNTQQQADPNHDEILDTKLQGDIKQEQAVVVGPSQQDQQLKQELKESEQKQVATDEQADEQKQVNNSHKADIPPGTFDNLDDYLAWYQASGHYKEGAPWVGIITYDSYFKNSDYEMWSAILKELESKGANALLVFSDSNNRTTVFHDFFMPDGRRQIDLLIAGVSFNYIYGLPEEGVKLFKQLNVPVMSPVYSSDLEEWQDSLAGIISEIPYQIAFPELDGRIEPVFIGGSTKVEVDENTGAEIVKKMPLPDRIERVVDRALAWTNLQYKDNADKKVALVYYNHHGGKDDVGASYLNSMASASVILEAMRDDGYTLIGDLSASAVEKIILNQGRNIGSWAPGELDTLVQAGALLLPVEKYMAWYNQIPSSLRTKLEKEWGPPPGKMMVHNGNLVIPGAMLGNIFLGPQPMRGFGEDPSKIAHSPDLPPPHQYIAFYLWLQNEFKADAVIHLGTHGTLEWLPGRGVGLGEDDWPDLLMGNMPDIYPYIVNNPGEGTQAKRRGYAVTINHLTPPMIQPGLYGTLDELQQLIIDYETAVGAGNAERATHLQEQIIEKIKENNLNQDLNLDLNGDSFSEVASILHEYLEDLATELMPYGLHTFGIPPQGEMLDLMVDSIVNYNAAARGGSRGEIKANLLLTTEEITNLLRALNGEYIEPGLGRDPVRVPDALPTGKNIVTFDPRMVPDEAAWRTGQKAADQLLEKFYDEHGRYPETVGVVLWAVETMRTQGESVGLILRLMGTEPTWDSSGRVNSVKVTPLDELGRPRVNVLVTISGLFRDTFGHTIGVLDEAFRLVAKLDEDPQRNYVRKTYEHLRDYLQKQGLSAQEAENLAQARIFGDAPGTYGTGVSDLAGSTGAWENSQQLADAYMNRMSYVYGKNDYGVPAKEAFKEILKSVDAITQVRDSLWGALDNDDVAQYLGGLKLAAEAASGKKVSSYIVNTRSGGAKVQTFSEFVGMELRSRLLNPKWIEGMMKEGYAGFREIGDHVANMFLVDATLGGLGDWAWQQVADTYIFNEQVMKQLDPFVAQSIIGWNLEAARRDMWQADEQTLAKLANNYVQTAAQYGVVCCHHTCSNIVFNEWAASYATVDDATMNQFKDVFYNSTDQKLNVVPSPNRPTEPVTPPSTPTRSSSSKRTVSPVPNQPTEPVLPTQPTVQPPAETPVPTAKPVQPTQPVEPQQRIPQPPVDAPAPTETPSTPPTAAGTDASETRALASSTTPVGDQVAQADVQPSTQTVAQRSPSSEQQQSNDAEAENEQGEKKVKAYELREENTGQPSSTGTKAVSIIAILVALGLVAVFLLGYIRKQK